MRYLPAILPFALLALLATAPHASAAESGAAAMLDRAAAAHAAAPSRQMSGRYEPWTPPALAPVPEPALWAMMIAGMGFTGATLRRRARRAART